MATRQTVIDLLGGKCQKCGSTTKLVLHHKDQNRKNNQATNIQVLCRRCHIEIHGGKRNGCRHQIVLSDDLSDKLRHKARKKGDISRIITEGLRMKLEEMEKNEGKK